MNSANRNGNDIDFTQNTYMTFRLSYVLKNGLSVDRNYFLFLTKDRMSEPGTYDNMIDSFVNSMEMKLRRLRFNDPRFQIMSGNIGVQKSDNGFEFSSRELQEVLNAIAEDAKAGDWGQYDWFENDDDVYAVQLFFWYSIKDIEELAARGADNITVYLRPGMTHTINALKKMGYVTDDDLITRTEMQKIWEERDKEYGKIYNPPDVSDAYYEGVPAYPETVPATEEATLPDGVDDTPDSSPGIVDTASYSMTSGAFET